MTSRIYDMARFAPPDESDDNGIPIGECAECGGVIEEYHEYIRSMDGEYVCDDGGNCWRAYSLRHYTQI